MASKPIKLKDKLIRGDTPVLSFPFTINDVAVDLTGWRLIFTATDEDTPENTNTPTIQISVDGDDTGVANFQLLQGQVLNDTLQLDPEKTYYWDVEFNNQLTGVDKRIFTPIRGTFEVDYDYTVGAV